MGTLALEAANEINLPVRGRKSGQDISRLHDILPAKRYSSRYVELDYALTKGIPFALVKNPTGNFIEPSLDSTQEAVSNAVALDSLPAGDKSWMKVSMLKAPGPKSYPIASFSYLLLYKEMSADPSIDQIKAKTLVDFISWAISDGQKLAANLGYVPLPARVVKGDQDTLGSLTFKGMPLYAGP